MNSYIQVLTTTNSKEKAEEIARRLLEKRLAGCVQIIGPIRSMYWWRNVIEEAEEWMCFIKTRAELYGDVEKLIRSLHSYEVPEIISLPITTGYKRYLEWLSSEVGDHSIR
ncbi:MAG: divalent-cation tolerance protein CutA [Nitrososphaerota archaeon]